MSITPQHTAPDAWDTLTGRDAANLRYESHAVPRAPRHLVGLTFTPQASATTPPTGPRLHPLNPRTPSGRIVQRVARVLAWSAVSAAIPALAWLYIVLLWAIATAP